MAVATSSVLWTHSTAPRESTTFWPLWWRVSLSIREQTTLNHISIRFLPQYQRQRNCFFQSASWKRHCVTHWREQRCLDSYRQRQISQSDWEISSNCGKIYIVLLGNHRWVWFRIYTTSDIWEFSHNCMNLWVQFERIFKYYVYCQSVIARSFIRYDWKKLRTRTR